MASALQTLLTINFRRWMSSRGFAMVMLAALVPVGLTGAWIGTHQGDLAATEIDFPETLVEGDNVTFSAVIVNRGSAAAGPFNASISVGRVVGNTLSAFATNSTTVERLAAGASTTVSLTWNARPGQFWALGFADSDDDVGEKEEFNNQKPVPFVVRFRVPAADQAPAAPTDLAGDPDASEEADLRVSALTLPASTRAGEPASFSVVVTNDGPAAVTNASAVLRVGRSVGGNFFPVQDESPSVDLAPGESRTLTLTWTAQEGAFWAEAFARVPAGVRDPDAGDNHASQGLAVQSTLGPDPTPPAPPERLTIKEFYLQILSLLHLRILIPFIALFYAGGVLADEKEAGTLGYLLTRPIPRWSIPLTKFLAGYLVAAVAVVIGMAASFALLFGLTPQGDVGFLTTPLLAGLVALFVYGGFFILLGTLVDRPYLVGVAFVVGWENVAGLLVPWVNGLTIHNYVVNAVATWPLDEGLQVLPTTGEGVQALLLVLAAGAAFLAGSAYLMKRREFEV